MPSLINQSFITAISGFSAQPAKAAWKFVTKFQENPAHPSLKLERIKNAKDKDFWSGRVNDDYRAVIAKKGDTHWLLHVAKHDDAYAWAGRHQLNLNPQTGGMQLTVLPEVFAEHAREVIAETDAVSRPATNKLFAHVDNEYLLKIGVPKDQLTWIRQFSDEEQLLKSEQQLGVQLFNKLSQVLDGNLPPLITPKKDVPVEAQPATLDEFYPVTTDTDLRPLLEEPFAAWLVFLHPSQRKIAESEYNGPIKVSGTAGTGKTVVALYRAANLARNGKRVLLCTYTRNLVGNLSKRANILLGNELDALSRLKIKTLHAVAKDVCTQAGKHLSVVTPKELDEHFTSWASKLGKTNHFLRAEWDHVIEHQGLSSLGEYLDAQREGRGVALPKTEREKIWPAFADLFERFRSRKQTSWAFYTEAAWKHLKTRRVESPFDAVVVDECQDFGFMETRFCGILSKGDLSFFGDDGQRIYAKSTSFQSLGIDVIGRSFTLKFNFRTTRQIRALADRIRLKNKADADGKAIDNSAAGSVLSGAEPILRGYNTKAEQAEAIVALISDLITHKNYTPDSIAVIGRSGDAIKAVSGCLKARGILRVWPKTSDDDWPDGVRMLTMHGTKGLEFRAVFIASVNADQIPNPQALESVSDDAKLVQDVMEQERNLLYVSMTRARDILYVSWVGNRSSLLDANI
jgi:hypothetical protein